MGKPKTKPGKGPKTGKETKTREWVQNQETEKTGQTGPRRRRRPRPTHQPFCKPITGPAKATAAECMPCLNRFGTLKPYNTFEPAILQKADAKYKMAGSKVL